MPSKPATRQRLLAENRDLRVRLAQAEASLREMRSGEVDALVVSDAGGVQLFAPADADQSFRILVGEMSEGALTMTAEGVIVYANRHFAGMLETPLEKLIGSTLRNWVAPVSQPVLQSLLEKGAGEERHAELVFAASDGRELPVHLSVSNLPMNGMSDAFCLVAFDLTERKSMEALATSESVARELLAAANQSRGELLRVIEQKTRAEAAQRLAEQQQRQLTDDLEVERSRLVVAQRIAKVGNWEMTLATTALHWSDETHRIHETDPATFHPTRQSYFDLIHPEDRARVDEAFERSLAGGADSAIDHRLLMPDKRIKFVEEHWQVFFDAQGVPIRAVGTCQDITERKHAERELRESRQRLDSIITSAMDAIVTVDEEQCIVLANPAAEKMFGYTAAEFRGQPLALLMPERFGAEHSAHIGAFGKAGVTSRRMGALRPVSGLRKNGEEFLIEASISKDDSTGRRFFTSILRDITERKRVESALLASNAQLQLLETCVSRLNDIVLITEAEPFDGPGPRIVFVNDAFIRKTGYSREDVRGKTPRILQGAKTQRAELDRVRAALERWEPVRSELINYTKAGEEYWLEMDIVPVADASGWYTNWIAVERDITQRKLAEVALRESELRYRSMFENNPLPMWVYDCETLAFLAVNDAAVAQYGYGREELQHMSLRDLLPAEDLSKLDARLAIDIQSRVAAAQVWTNLRKDGTRIQVEVSGHAMDFQGRSARLVLLNDITERIQSQAKIHQLAFHDSLTGLPNRRQFLNYASEVLRKSKLESDVNACILLDLDHFKRINDHWGHPCGDELLKQVGLRVQQCLPPSGYVARLGGDEFIVLITAIGVDQAAATLATQVLCSKILVTLARGFLIDKREHFTSASLGIALFGNEPITVIDLLSRVDSAMYSAKADGRNSFRFFDRELQARLSAQSELEGDIRQCIQNAELHLVYQPQINHLGNMVGSEALLRWTHPTRGLVSPAEFIPAAENSGFILQIGQWVVHTACMTLAEWQSSETTARLTMAVNVSAKQFHHPDFVSHVLSALENSGANPALLELELTESLLAQDLNGIVQKMNALKAVGVTFSLDDFGTGYSSLAYLKRLPLSQLKIDQGFVRDVLVDISDAVIVRTVIALGEKLGLNVIAEGVETQAQREFLAVNGCLFYQGYLFSRPLKKEDFKAFCAARAVA